MASATTGMPRVVLPEVLDALPASDPDAQRARRDLRRVHRVMRTRSILVRALGDVLGAMGAGRATLRIIELGAGDGTLMLGVARVLARGGVRAQLALLDRQHCVDPATLAAYASIGWDARPVTRDVGDWIAEGVAPSAHRNVAPPWDIVVANLFLHHFETPTLSALLEAVARRARGLVACEPRRDALALGGSYLIGVLGAGAVTRKDAVLSVRAGFTGQELSALWRAVDPERADFWQVREQRAFPFSHLFTASRRPSRHAPTL